MSTWPTLSQAGPQAESIRFLLWVTLGLGAVILTVVVAMVVVALVRYRGRGDPEDTGARGNLKLEIFWTAIPTIIVAVLFVMTVRQMSRIDPSPDPDRTPDVVVVGHQWWWEVRYPGTGAVTANEIHVPTGQRLLFRIESADVVHDFWAPQLTRKIDAVPGHPNTIWMEVDEPGTYLGRCAEFCGAQHANMGFKVFAEPPDSFRTWVQAQAATAAPPMDSTSLVGVQLFLGSGQCARCHTIRGLSEGPNVGPDLTHVGSRTTLAAGMIPNTREALSRWMRNPQAVKPGAHMPNLELSDDQVHAVVTYLEGLQ